MIHMKMERDAERGKERGREEGENGGEERTRHGADTARYSLIENEGFSCLHTARNIPAPLSHASTTPYNGSVRTNTRCIRIHACVL